MSPFRILAVLVWFVTLGAIALPSHGQAPQQSITTDSGAVAVLTPAKTLSANQDTITLGVEFRLEPKWKIYWKNPGIAGYPPSVDLSQNDTPIDGVVMDFPPPLAKTVLGYYSYVYEDYVVFPITVPLRTIKNAPVTIDVTWVACNEVCIPQNAVFNAPLIHAPNVSGGNNSMLKYDPETIAVWQDKIPVKMDSGASGDTKVTAQITLKNAMETHRVLTLTTPPTEKLFLYHDDHPVFTPKWHKHDVQKSTFTYDVTGDLSTQKPINITFNQNINSKSQYFEINKYLVISDYQKTNLLWIAVMAFMGGLILNIMPCVLPVLGIKALSLTQARAQGHPLYKIRLSFVFTSVGIVLSFLVLGMVLYALKSTSEMVGWGIQFQNPIFLWVLFITIALFALMLIFDYSIPLPAFIRTADVGKDGYMGDMFKGVLAMVLSTPCSAPILGTAIGLILSLETIAIPALFTVMGVGMAFPYLLFALVPSTLSLLPKPGGWMNGFKRFIGIFLALTALWLGKLAMGSVTPTPNNTATTQKQQSLWQPWDVTQQSTIEQAIARGQTVLVDITADWCITCQFNKFRTLDTPKTIEFLKQNKTLLLRKDWTDTDDSVPPYLATFNKYGIPFNVVYGPSAPNGIVLSEILSYDDIVTAINQAK